MYQNLIKLKKLFGAQAPIAEIIQFLNTVAIEDKICKAKHWKHSKYLDDKRYVMRSLLIHSSAIAYSSNRLGIAVIKTVDIIVQVMNKNNATESVFNHITFYKDGSLLINCGMQPHNTTIVISIVKPDTKK